MVKIIIGIIMVIGGLSGNLVLVGTNSGAALAGAGRRPHRLGIVKMVRQKQNSSDNKT